MKISTILPNRSVRSGLLETIACFSDAAAVEFGPEGTMHYWTTSLGITDAHIYTSGIREPDIIFGKTKRIENAVQEISELHADELSCLFIISSCVSDIIGTDLDAVVSRMQKNCSISLKAIGNLSFDDDYTRGIHLAYTNIAQLLPEILPEKGGAKKGFGILGLHPNEYRAKADYDELRRLIREGTGLECLNDEKGRLKLEDTGSASFYLVLRHEALPLAQQIETLYGIPYLFIRPYGISQTVQMLDFASGFAEGFRWKETSLRNELEYSQKIRDSFSMQMRQRENPSVLIHCDIDAARAAAFFLKQDCGMRKVQPVCTTQERHGLTGEVIHTDADEKFCAFIRQNPPSFLLTDEVYMHQLKDTCRTVLFSQPLLHVQDWNRYLPFMGFRGAVCLMETLAGLV